MPERPLDRPADSLTTCELLREAVRLAAQLVQQQGVLAGTELRQELGQIKSSALILGAGTGLLALCGGLSALSAVALVERYGRLPRWAIYGLAAGATGISGLGLLAVGQKQAGEAARRISFPETSRTLRENIAWIEEQLSTLPH